jgi:hypothetical protein
VSPYVKPLGSSGGQKPGSKKPGQGNNANTDSELYVGKSGPALHVKQGTNSGIGSGSRNVSVSLAQRQQERRVREQAVIKEVESQKQAVLEKLNKIQNIKLTQQQQ